MFLSFKAFHGTDLEALQREGFRHSVLEGILQSWGTYARVNVYDRRQRPLSPAPARVGDDEL